MAIKFGTEGWRAIIAEEYTFENVRTVSQAIAEHYLATVKSGPPSLVIGHDTRFLSDQFARAVAEVLAANGIRALLSDRALPTPAVSRYVVEHTLPGGVMITASHNPPAYNGVKIKAEFGGSATSETVASIEQRIGRSPVKRLPIGEATERGFVKSVNLQPDFLNGIKRSVNLKAIRASKLRVLLDPMHGAAGTFGEQLLTGGRCKVKTLHPNPDPLFGGHAPEPIAKHLTDLAQTLKRSTQWDIGLATDGDADRLGVIAPNGGFLNPGQILCVLLEHLITVRGLKGAVVKTVSNTSMIERMTSDLGITMIETPVGFKHITKLMIEDHVLIGGEESGGIGIQGYLPERDGIYMGLLVLEAMAFQKKGILEILKRLQKKYGAWQYTRQDLTVQPDQVDKLFTSLTQSPPKDMAGIPVARVNTMDGVKLIGRDGSWLLFRRSGTEPIVRVYAESLSAAQANRLLAYGVQLAKRQ